MVTSILAIAAALVGLAVWWFQRQGAKQDDPLEQHRRRYAGTDAEIAGAKPGAAGHGLADDLDELERLQRAKDSRR